MQPSERAHLQLVWDIVHRALDPSSDSIISSELGQSKLRKCCFFNVVLSHLWYKLKV